MTTAAELAASVIVPTHRGAHRLPPLLAALAAQDTTEPWEVVVVVDGADPATLAVLDEAAASLPLEVVVRQESGGVAVALNTAIARARGRVVIRCDDDLTPGPDMVRRHLDHHRDRDDLGVIGPTRDVLADSPYALAYGRAANARALAVTYAREEGDRWVAWAAHNSVTRAALDRVGGYDESYSYREDSDLGLRLLRSGVQLVVDPALEIEHRGPATDAATRAARAWVSGASEVLFTTRHPRPDDAPRPPRRRPATVAWDGATAVLGRVVRTREGARRVGGVVDLLLPRVSPTTGGHLVALVVEAAGRSGRRHGDLDQRLLRTQKSDELATEQRRRG